MQSNKRQHKLIYRLFIGLVFVAILFIVSAFVIKEKPFSEKNLPEHKVHAPFNKQYNKEDLGQILSWIDCGKALSAVGYHRGLMVTPISFDFGGGIGDGAFVAYNIDDPRNPKSVFDSRDYPELYHTKNTEHYLGDLGEHHGLYFHKDMILLTDRGENHNGFLILDLSPLYDNNPKTLPKVVSRYHFPGVEKSTVYDGFSFAPAWVGGKYVYAPTGSTGLFIISTENLAEPKLLSHTRKEELYNQTLRSVHPIGDLLVLSPAAIASTKGDMVLMDVSNPKNPNLISRQTIKVGYQGILYGNRFYNGAFTGNKNKDKYSNILTYDFTNPFDIKEIELATTDKLLKPEYAFLKDDNLFLGHYPGLSRWDIKDDKATFIVAVEPQHPPANDYAFVSPLGNLVIVTSDHKVDSKLNIGVHQIEPDLKDPVVKSVRPKNLQKNVSVFTKIGISFSDFIDNECLEKGAIYIKEKGSGNIIESGFSHGMGIVHAIPLKPLKKNTSYEIHITKNMMDMVGNSYIGKSLISEFSTGSEITDYNVQILVNEPKEVNKKVKLKAVVRNNKQANSKILYSWNFGDGKENTPFSLKNNIKKKYKKAGNYNITLITKKENSDKQITTTAVQVIYNGLPKSKGNSSSTVSLDDEKNRFYVVNPDNNSITAINPKTGTNIFEKETGNNPTSIVRFKDQLWVSCTKEDAINVFDSETGKLINTISLDYASAPQGIVVNIAEEKIYVALSSSGIIQEIDAKTYQLERKIQLEKPLRQLAYIPKTNTIVAPQFIANNQKGGKVFWVDEKNWKISNTERLAPTLVEDGLSNGRGYPNYLGTIAVNPEQTELWISAKKDNLFRGLKRDGKPLIFDHTVRSIATNFNIKQQKENQENRLDFDNSDFTSAATYNSFGNLLYITTWGSQTITAIDAYNPKNQSTFNTYGDGPISIIGNDKGNRLYVHNQLSRSISVFESKTDGELIHLTKWSTITKEKMDYEVLDGKRIFNKTNISNLSREGYMSCASCHIDGSQDGRIWDLSSLGEGLRNTIDLRGKEGMKHGTLHWSANFDEIQDFDDQIVNLNEGTGFLFDATKPAHKRFFPSKAGLNNGLDNLAKYVTSLSDYLKSWYKTKEGKMTNDAVNGRKHFIKMECYSCHSGNTFTDSGFGKLHNVGTITENSGSRLTKQLLGIDTPTLIGLASNMPYLHDGSATTLRDVFNAGKGEKVQVHKKVNTLKQQEINELLAYILQLDSEEGITPEELNIVNIKPKFNKKEYKIEHQYYYTVAENIVGNVEATDSDENQKLTYKIIPSVYSQLFSIDSVSGQIMYQFKEIYLKNIANMVLTSKKTFPFKVLVEDNGIYRKKDTASVIVNVKFPNIPITTKELNEFKKLQNVLDKGQKLKGEKLKRKKELDEKVNSF
jgi:DNA-binding beta-propeller fold protein YncE